MARKLRKGPGNGKAFLYLRLSVDKEDGNAQSIDAQRNAATNYARQNGIQIVGEYVESGFSGTLKSRPEFNRMIVEATGHARPVQYILIYRQARFARNATLFFQTTEALAEAGVEMVSVTENFGTGRSKRMGQGVVALMDEQRAIDDAIYTCKSRRENARKGFYNGGPVPFGYETYVAHTDGSKERRKLRLLESEAILVRQIFDWAEQGRGGRWIVKTLNDRGATLRGAKFSNGNVSGILSRETYTGRYFDRTADDDGFMPEREDWIEVTCPVIISREQFERVAALRVARSPRQMAPHQAAGTTLLTGIAKCGMPGCGSGMTIGSGTSRSKQKYYYYKCNERTNIGQRCTCPNVRREVLDESVFSAVKKRLLRPDRISELLRDVLVLSDEKRKRLEQELAQAKAERTRRRTAIDRLLMLVEEGVMKAGDPELSERLTENRAAISAASERINVLESQLARGSRKITPEVIAKFTEQYRAKLDDKDSTLRKAYLRMLVSKVEVSDKGVLIRGPKSVLERGLAKGLPRLEGSVPIFDQQWCRLQDSNLWPHHYE
ncbi:MAG: recombinase family protein [Erythrobacter sp.]